MKHLFFSFLVLYSFSNFNLSAQDLPLNAELVAHVPFAENSSGMWGYKDAQGIKYAVIGTLSATRIFSLEDPKNPIERLVAGGAVGNWREARYYKNYIYVSTDQGADGLLVIDMTLAPDSISYSYYKPEITIGTTTRNLGRCHNIFIDEKGFCYLSGCSISNRGVLVFDLNQNPIEPPFVGYSDLRYSHDVYTKNDTMYNSEINNGLLSIYDVKDKADIKLMTSFSTGRTFTHNAWTSDDSKYVFTTDERANAYVESYDISDFNNVKLLDRFRPLRSENSGVIPHNTYYKNGYLITSYYTDGIIIIDAHKPDNLVEVAYYDTWNDPSICHSGFHGVWGVYPLDDEDYVYGSDIENGLFILKFNYQRACYLEGKITDAGGTPISNAIIEIISDQKNRELSGPSGDYKTGQVLSGSFIAKISHPDYYSKEVPVQMDHGVVTNLDVILEKRKISQVTFIIKNTNDFPIGTAIKLIGDGYEYNLETNGIEEYKTSIRDGKYNVVLSAWGYTSVIMEEITVQTGQDNSYKITLDNGYADNFESDLKWTVNSTQNMPGAWVRAIPRQTEYLIGEIANPRVDAEDFGQWAYVTGNGIPGAGCEDVDNGITKLISPLMDLTSFQKPELNYDVWFYNSGGSVNINDTLIVKLKNGEKEVIVDKIYGTTNGWLKVRNLDIESFISVSNQMNMIVEASDQQGNLGHIVEAGFDHFFITEQTSSVNDPDITLKSATIYPNPAQDMLYIRLGESTNQSLRYAITNLLGKQMKTGELSFHSSSVDIGTLESGFYILQLNGHHAIKFLKH